VASSDIRLPRFVRHRFRKPGFVLQPRDREIIRIIAQHRLIASNDICLLVGSSEQGILRRLQKLFHHGFVDRPRVQRHFGNAPLVYALGQRGADVLAEEAGRKPSADWSEKNRSLQAPYLDHALMISHFQTALRHACASCGTVQVERWYGDGFLRDRIWVEDDGRRVRVPVAPDAFCILRVLDGRTGERIHAFLEADRSTMETRRFLAKMRGYIEYRRSREAERRLGARNFLVVVVTKSQERADNLLVAAARSLNGRTLRPFVFAAEKEFLPAGRLRIFDPIWRTPADASPHSILE